MTELLLWQGNFLYAGKRPCKLVGEFAAMESGVCEFFPSAWNPGYIPICVFEEIVRKWHELNDAYLEQMDKDLKELAGET